MHLLLQVRDAVELPEDGSPLQPDSTVNKGGLRVRVAEVGGG